MAERMSRIDRSRHKLVFASPEPTFNSMGSFWFLVVATTFVVAIHILAAVSSWTTVWQPKNAGACALFLLFGYFLFHATTRQRIVEIDVAARRLKIYQRSFGRWTKAMVDCSLAQCKCFGTIEYNNEGHTSYGTYVQLKDGKRHAIPLKDATFETANAVATQLSTATRIPRLDA